MEKSIGAKNAEESDNDTGSNDDEADDEDDDDTRSISLLARDGSDNGSGTQVTLILLVMFYFNDVMIPEQLSS